MSVLVYKNRVVGMTKDYYPDNLIAWCCYLNFQTESENLELFDMPLLRRHPDAFKAVVSNDLRHAKYSAALCFQAIVKSKSFLSIECILLEQPPF
jgi:hypothetical protein